MKKGIFSAEFLSNQEMAGFSVAVFAENTVHGGDASYYYRGKYRLEGKNLVSGTIDVARYSTLHNSVFGTIGNFKLKLNGVMIVTIRNLKCQDRSKGIQN